MNGDANEFSYYLGTRGISPQTARRFRLGTWKSGLVFPFVDNLGTVFMYRYRDIFEKKVFTMTGATFGMGSGRIGSPPKEVGIWFGLDLVD